jgi:hypothetical protein
MEWLIDFLFSSPNGDLTYGIAPAAIGMGLQAIGGIASGLFGRGKRRRARQRAQADFDVAKQRFMERDLSDPTAGLSSQLEDISLSGQAQEMQLGAQQQALSDTMGSMRQTAGASGIAALAQSLAGQQAKNIQATTAGLAQQEANLQMAQAGEQSQLQQARMQGDLRQRSMQNEYNQDMLQMSGQALGRAKAAEQAGNQALIGGVTTLATGGLSAGLSKGGGNFMEKFGGALEGMAGGTG